MNTFKISTLILVLFQLRAVYSQDLPFIGTEGQLEQPITDRAILYVEVIPEENDLNNFIDQFFVLTDGVNKTWEGYGVATTLTSRQWYIKSRNGKKYSRNKEIKVPMVIGHKYYVWMDIDMKAKTYDLYTKADFMDSVTQVMSESQFNNDEVKRLTHWHSFAKDSSSAKVLSVKEVSAIGTYPEGRKFEAYVAPVEEVIPEGAIVIEKPDFLSKSSPLNLKKVVITDVSTTLHFRTKYRPINWIYLNKEEIYLGISSTQEKLKLVSAEGINLDVRYYLPTKGYIDYKLVFPPIDPNTNEIDFIDNSSGGWYMYGIELQEKEPSKIPNTLLGNWMDMKSGDWLISITEDKVIYNKTVWDYEKIPETKSGTLQIKNETGKLAIGYKLNEEGKLVMNFENNEVVLDQHANYFTAAQPSNPPAFETPSFKIDTAILSGYVKGFTPRMKSTTGLVYVNNVISGEQETHILKVQESGYFKMKIPMTHPQPVMVRAQGLVSTRSVFLTPGKKSFVYSDLKGKKSSLFMGENARLNWEKTQGKLSFFDNDHWKIMENILDKDAYEYKEFRLGMSKDQLERLEKLKREGVVSDRYYNYIKRDIFNYASRHILYYHWDSEQAYNQKNGENITRSKRDSLFIRPNDKAYYDFIKEEIINDPKLTISSGYSGFINAAKYSKGLYNVNRVTSSYLHEDLLDAGVNLTDEEQRFIRKMEKIYSPKVIAERERFSKEYGKAAHALLDKNKEFLSELEKEEPAINFQYLLDHNENLTTEETRLAEIALKHYNSKSYKSSAKFYRENKKWYEDLYKKYADELTNFRRKKRLSLRVQAFEDLGLSKGIGLDIMHSQDLLRSIVSEMTPLDSNELMLYRDLINNEGVWNYIVASNEETKTRIEANKNNENYTLNRNPEVEEDQVFSSIIEKYKGKVIYVDFWATWCGPCLYSMKKQKGMKETVKDEDIVFVYLTGPTSPLKTYENMIPTISGEHYRLSNDEWNYVKSEFNVSGIPHYVIVDKKGNIVDPNAPRDPQRLLKIFKELMEEEG